MRTPKLDAIAAHGNRGDLKWDDSTITCADGFQHGGEVQP